jgi:hypothetical protein
VTGGGFNLGMLNLAGRCLWRPKEKAEHVPVAFSAGGWPAVSEAFPWILRIYVSVFQAAEGHIKVQEQLFGFCMPCLYALCAV